MYMGNLGRRWMGEILRLSNLRNYSRLGALGGTIFSPSTAYGALGLEKKL